MKLTSQKKESSVSSTQENKKKKFFKSFLNFHYFLQGVCFPYTLPSHFIVAEYLY